MEVVLTPDPQRHPPGSKVKFYPEPTVGGKLEGQPPGTLLEEATVAADGTLTVKGVTEGAAYVGWTSGNTYLHFVVPIASGSEGLSKAAVEALIAEKAVSSASPAFTGLPTAPTAAPGTNTTQLATTAFDAAAVLVERTRAETAEGLKAAKASNLSDLASASTARTNLGLGTAATTAATAYDAAGVAATAQTAAELAASPRLKVKPTAVTAGQAAPLNELLRVDATAGSLTVTAPTGAAAGSVLAVEKTDTSTNEVVIKGKLRGEAETEIKIRLQNETAVLIADASGFWWPVAKYVRIATLDERFVSSTAGAVLAANLASEAVETAKIKLLAITTGLLAAESVTEAKLAAALLGPAANVFGLRKLGTGALEAAAGTAPATAKTEAEAAAKKQPIFQIRTIVMPAGTAPGNEVLAGWDIKLASGEERKIIWARYRTTSGTIKLAIKRGEAGATEIAAYKELAAASTVATTTSTQALSDADFVTVTGSAGSTPKGLFLTVCEEVIR